MSNDNLKFMLPSAAGTISGRRGCLSPRTEVFGASPPPAAGSRKYERPSEACRKGGPKIDLSEKTGGLVNNPFSILFSQYYRSIPRQIKFISILEPP